MGFMGFSGFKKYMILIYNEFNNKFETHTPHFETHQPNLETTGPSTIERENPPL